ncbi:unnamed protein product, partial [Rotaria sp. Silwood1]
CANGDVMCYFCSNCPYPFNAKLASVTTARGTTGFCARKSYSADPSAPNSRGPAEPGLCSWLGCKWIIDPTTGRQMYTCCCTSDYCNCGNSGYCGM